MFKGDRKRLVLSLLVLAGAVLLIKGLLVGRHVIALTRYALHLSPLARNPGLVLDIDRARQAALDLRGAGATLHNLRSDLDADIVARWLPWPTGRRNLQAMDQLLDVGGELAGMAGEVLSSLQPMLAAVQAPPESRPAATPGITATPHLGQTTPSTEAPIATRAPTADNHPPLAAGVRPGSGYAKAGMLQLFTTTWIDADGWQDLDRCLFLIGVNTGTASCAYLRYSPAKNRLFLLDDAGEQWLGGVEPGSSGTIANSQVEVNCSQTTIIREPDRVHLTWALRFLPAFAGPRNLYVRCSDASADSKWKQVGTWLVTLEEASESAGMSDIGVAVLEEAQQAQAEMRDGALRLAAIRQQIRPLSDEALWTPLDVIVRLMERYLPQAQAALETIAALPDLLGQHRPVNYLILAQNRDELRPTGGFISSIGLLTLDRGRVVELTSRDSYDLDKFTVDHPFAPEPMQKYMDIWLWATRDGNWSPDFPTAARDIERLYDLENEPPIDGVIALDQTLLQRLVEVVGPIQVPGETRSITGETFLPLLEEAWIQELPPEATKWGEWQKRRWLRSHRKDLVAPLAQALFDRLHAQSAEDWIRVLRVMIRAMEEKHLLIYLDSAEAQHALQLAGWDGALDTSQGIDSLLVVDMNMGYNKVNANIDRRIEYTVSLGDTPRATLTVNYRNHSPQEQGCDRSLAITKTYEMRAEGCYWNYLRVYAPAGSRLLATKGVTETATFTETGKQVFATFFVVPTAAEKTVEFSYELPPMTSNEYRLVVQKQPGTDASPLTIVVTLPPGVTRVSSEPQPSSRRAGALVYDLDLRQDRRLHLKLQ